MAMVNMEEELALRDYPMANIVTAVEEELPVWDYPMANSVTAEVEELAAWDYPMANFVTAEEEGLPVRDYPKPSSPWEPSVKAFVEFTGYDYDSYSVVLSPLWESPNTHIPQLLLPPCNVTKGKSPPATRSRLTISVPNLDVVVDLLSQINASIWNYTFNNPNNAPNFTYWIQPHLVSINLTQAEATRLLFPNLQCTTDEATNKGYLSVGKYSGLLFSEKILKTSGSVSDSEPRPSKGEICFSTLYDGQTIMVYLSARMSTEECVALSVRVDTGDKDHPLSTLIAKTNQRILSLGKRRRAPNTFASADVPTHFAANFVDTACSMKRKCRQYADPQFLSPYLQNDERSLLEVKAVEDYEIVSLRVFSQTFCNTSLLPDSSASTSQICNLNGCNQQRSLRSMSELTKPSWSFLFLGNSQVSSLHETPMQHMPAEFVPEDSLFCPPQPEQLTRDTVPHMNHTFPPESTRQGEDNIPNCDSFQSPVEGKAINNDEGDFSSASQTVNASGNLLKNNKRRIRRLIKIEDLRPFLGKTTRVEAAKSLGVSVSTVKRICNKNKIQWPRRKLNKIGASIQSSLTEPFQVALPFNPHAQAAVQPFQPDAPFNPPPRQLSTITVAQTTPPERRMQDANFVTIKASHDGTDTIVKFDLPSSATKDDLEGKVAKKLNLKVGSFTIKYQEQEGEWITVTDSEDLQYCIREHGSLASIGMVVQSTSSGSGPT